jgi:hypothetical protein
MVLPLQTGGSTTLSVTGNAGVRTGDGASMRRSRLKCESIRVDAARTASLLARGAFCMMIFLGGVETLRQRNLSFSHGLRRSRHCRVNRI